MEKSFDPWALLNDQLSFTESQFQAKRESRLRGALTDAEKAIKKKDWPTYWAYLYQAAGQAGFDDSSQEETVVGELDDKLRGMANG